MRITQVTTRTGDDGTTGLADGRRLHKDHARIAVLGSVDELNSLLGLLLTEDLPDEIRTELLRIQHELFGLGGALALPGAPFNASRVARLDAAIARFNASLPPLAEFVLPGGCRAAALCHVARSVARRAERDYLHLSREESVPREGLHYLNRLSDLLFILARQLNRAAGASEVLWAGPQDPSC